MRLLFKKKKSRNRTSVLRGERAPKPSYYSSAPAKTPPRSPFKKRPNLKNTRKRLLRWFINTAVLILILSGLIYSLVIKPQPHMVVNNTSYHSASDYRSAAVQMLGALRNKNKLTVDKKGIESTFKHQFPEIDTARLDLSIFSQIPTLNLNIAVPTFNLSSNNNLYVIGSNGVVAVASSRLPEASKLPTVIDQSGFEITPGKQVLSQDAVGFINTLLVQCKRANVKIQSLTLPAVAESLELRTEGSVYFVKFNLRGDALRQVGQYLAAKHKFDSDGTQPSQYLDVRVAGKIYYR